MAVLSTVVKSAVTDTSTGNDKVTVKTAGDVPVLPSLTLASPRTSEGFVFTRTVTVPVLTPPTPSSIV